MSKNIVRAKISTSTGIISSQTPVTLANSQSVTIFGPNRFDSLSDVVAVTELDGAVPVYDSSIDKYVVKHISANLVSGYIDGGNF